MTRSLKIRLSLMMLLQYSAPATTVPIMSHYLKNVLHFQASQAGWILAMPPFAAIVAPLAASHFADRRISTERMLALCHVLCAGVMLWLSRLTAFWPVFAVYLLYGLCFAPTFGLSNAAALHQTSDARRDFGGIRMWGTFGWVMVAWLFGYGWVASGPAGSSRLSHALPLSAILSVVMAAYTLSFRPSIVRRPNAPQAPYRDVVRIFMRPEMLVLCAASLLNSAIHQFYYFGISLHLHQAAVPDRLIMPIMSIGQTAEVIMLGTLGWFLARMSMKTAMIIAVAAQTLRFVLFAYQDSIPLIILGISLHGIAYAFFFTTAYLYLEQHSTPGTRAGVQQVLTIMISGAGTLLGSLTAGYTAQYFSGAAGRIDFHAFWLTPALVGVATALGLAWGFHEKPAETA